jgi:hypothetical protein
MTPRLQAKLVTESATAAVSSRSTIIRDGYEEGSLESSKSRSCPVVYPPKHQSCTDIRTRAHQSFDFIYPIRSHPSSRCRKNC